MVLEQFRVHISTMQKVYILHGIRSDNEGFSTRERDINTANGIVEYLYFLCSTSWASQMATAAVVFQRSSLGPAHTPQCLHLCRRLVEQLLGSALETEVVALGSCWALVDGHHRLGSFQKDLVVVEDHTVRCVHYQVGSAALGNRCLEELENLYCVALETIAVADIDLSEAVLVDNCSGTQEQGVKLVCAGLASLENILHRERLKNKSGLRHVFDLVPWETRADLCYLPRLGVVDSDEREAVGDPGVEAVVHKLVDPGSGCRYWLC